jgi:hypothetical protein
MDALDYNLVVLVDKVEGAIARRKAVAGDLPII